MRIGSNNRRFSGADAEPRDIPSGHCPTALNLPFQRLISPDGTMLDEDKLKLAFEEAGCYLDRDIVVMCGSGVTACILYLALDILKFKHNARLYDGSWSEYASYPSSPIKTY